jgi:ferredoxin
MWPWSRKSPELLPGADPEQDCLPAAGETPDAVAPDVLREWQPRRTRLEQWAERLALAVEEPVTRLINAPQFNPLYYSGTLTVLLLIIVGATGLYLFFFFGYGYQASYRSVLIIDSLPVGRIIRSIHRYASGAALVTGLIHAVRLWYMGRSRGPRWLAWVSGVVMVVLIGLGGVTGYWLIMDQRAQLITDTLLRASLAYTGFGEWLANQLILMQRPGQSLVPLVGLFLIHLGLYVALIGFIWLHVLRLQRPRVFPTIAWLVGALVVLFVAAALVPAEMLLPINLEQQPGAVTLDALFLAWLPIALRTSPLLPWAALAVLALGAALIPWLARPGQSPRIVVNGPRCTGCTKCAIDCPYKAIVMQPRTDGRRHKYIAVADQNLCVSCGLCLGSCDVLALSLGPQPMDVLQQNVLRRLARVRAQAGEKPVKVVFTCERHAAHGARPYLDHALLQPDGALATVIPVPCVGALHPNLLTRTVDAGAAEVRVIGCPPGDCAQREGNQWLHERLARLRLPRLKRSHVAAPIVTRWLPPNDFTLGLNGGPGFAGEYPWADLPEKERLPAGLMRFARLGWRNYIVAFGFLALALVVQVFISRLWFQPQAEYDVLTRVAVPDLPQRAPTFHAEPARLSLEVDGQTVWERRYAAGELAQAGPVFSELTLEPGAHHLRLAVSGAGWTVILLDEARELRAGQIAWLLPDDRPGHDDLWR